MRFDTLAVIAASSLALVSAKPHAMMKRYANETMPAFTPATSLTETIPSLTSSIPSVDASSSIATTFDTFETMPTITPTNTTVGAINNASSLATSEIVQVSTSVNAATLTYTSESDGSSIVGTTTVEETTTIKMTSTMYLTVTSYSDSSSATPEPTTTVTSYSTTTKTLTLQAVTTDNVNSGTTPDQPSDGGSFFQSGNPASNPDSSGNPNANSGFSTPGMGGCGVTTVTATIYEKSTVTVTPLSTVSSSTDVLPIAPTAKPSYGFGNGTDSNGPIYGSASSGFLTFHRPQPTGY